MEAGLPPFGWPNYVLGSHDADRLASRIGTSQARVAAMLILTLRGTPTLYYGDELGMINGMITPENMQDPQGFRLGLHGTRDTGRTPMQWNLEQFAGFSTVEPWLPVGEDYVRRNVVRQKEDPTSILNLYRQLLWYRRNTPALVQGSYRPLDVGHEGCYVYAREHPEGSRLIALNFTDQFCTIAVPYNANAEIAISTFLDRTGIVSLSNLSLRPHEGTIIEVNS
jgi:alpha-glucosidase